MEGKVFRERAILRFIPDGVSIDDAAACFASQMCWVTPAARGNCCCSCCWSALFAAAGNVCTLRGAAVGPGRDLSPGAVVVTGLL